jgi:hypothetical protein
VLDAHEHLALVRLVDLDVVDDLQIVDTFKESCSHGGGP